MKNEFSLDMKPIDCVTMSEEFKSNPFLARLYNSIADNCPEYVNQKDKIQEVYVDGIFERMAQSNLWGNTRCFETLKKKDTALTAIWDYGFSCEFMGFKMGFEAALKLFKETKCVATE